MHVHDLKPPSPGTLADWSDVASLQQRMVETVQAMSVLAPEVGLARHVLEYDNDRRKQALARAMKAPLAGGESAAKAEAEARSNEAYAKEINMLSTQHTAAEQTVTQWESLKLKWETSRSLLSMQKETVRHL